MDKTQSSSVINLSYFKKNEKRDFSAVNSVNKLSDKEVLPKRRISSDAMFTEVYEN